MNDMPETLRKMVTDARKKHVQKGQILFYLGDEPNDIYMLQDGYVKIHNIDDAGNEKVLHILGPYGVMPFALFSGNKTPTKWFYTALTDCDLIILPYDELVQSMREYGNNALYLMNWFSLEVHELLVRLDSMGKSNVQDKLLVALRFLAVRYGVERRSGWTRIQFSVNHQLVADMIGVTRESAAMAMKDLSDKTIVRNPRLTILEIKLDKLIEFYKSRNF